MRRWLLWKRGVGWVVPLGLLILMPTWLGTASTAWRIVATAAFAALVALSIFEWRVRRRR